MVECSLFFKTLQYNLEVKIFEVTLNFKYFHELFFELNVKTSIKA